MIVRCLCNDLSALASQQQARRLRESSHLDHPLYELKVGALYAVQAMEQWHDGWRLYLHTDEQDRFPRPYPLELFEIVDDTLSAGWRINLAPGAGEEPRLVCAFPEWSRDPGFYKRLIDDDEACVALYRRYRLSDCGLNELDRDQRLLEAIQDVLLREWDPIGVKDVPEAADEYVTYGYQIWRMLLGGRPLQELTDYLWWAETEHMALGVGSREATHALAERLARLPQEVDRELAKGSLGPPTSRAQLHHLRDGED